MSEEKTKVKITKRSEDFSKWYHDVIFAADFADYASVKGCMVIKPYGYAVWENAQKKLDADFKATGHKNACFPLLIPESYLKKEADHVEGFAPELAVVTHAGGKKLEENLVVRPTSETVIYSNYAKWINSWRDLPLLINQWANVVRWEKRTKLFLRTSEFLWQEGHTVHATHEEAEEEVERMLEIYRRFVEDYLAVPLYAGAKSEMEKFAGALKTLTIEGMMQDKKALQCGTSHDLGQNFAKAFDVKFLDKDGESKYAWQTCWGISTRIIGAMIMVHGDDNGVVIPPKVAPVKAVIVPIWKSEEEKKKAVEVAYKIKEELKSFDEVVVDERDLRPAHRFYEWERKGVPLRIEVGPRDVKEKKAVFVRRDNKEKQEVLQSEVLTKTEKVLEDIQSSLFNRAKKFMEENTFFVETWDEFEEVINEKGGFVKAKWCDSTECEEKIKEKTKATTRCLEDYEGEGECVFCGEKATKLAIFALAY